MFRSPFADVANQNRRRVMESRIFRTPQDDVRMNEHDIDASEVNKFDFVSVADSYTNDGEGYEPEEDLNKVYRPEILRQIKLPPSEKEQIAAQELDNIIYTSSPVQPAAFHPLPEFNMNVQQRNDDLCNIRVNYRGGQKKNDYRKLHVQNQADLVHLRDEIERETNALRSYHRNLFK